MLQGWSNSESKTSGSLLWRMSGPNDCTESLVLNANAVQIERNGAGLIATGAVCPKQLTEPTIVRDCRDLSLELQVQSLSVLGTFSTVRH